MIKIGIIDDHHAVAQGLSLELLKDKSIELLYIVSEREKIMEALAQQLPDVLIMDVVMPGTVSIESFKEVLKRFPEIKIVAYTALNSPMIVELLLKSGVKGYVNKSQPLNELKDALLKVYEGKIYLPHEYDFIKKRLANHAPLTELSKREIEILILIAQELKTSEIADKLFISVSTVETHRKSLFQKLNVANLAGLIKAGINLGYIQ